MTARCRRANRFPAEEAAAAGAGGSGGARRRREPVEQGGQAGAARTGLIEHMGRALQIGFFLPFPLFGAGVDDDRALGAPAAQFLEEPDALHAGQLDIHDAGLRQTMGQQRLRLVQAGAVEHAVLFGIEPPRGSPRRNPDVSASTKSGFHFTGGPAGV